MHTLFTVYAYLLGLSFSVVEFKIELNKLHQINVEFVIFRTAIRHNLICNNNYVNYVLLSPGLYALFGRMTQDKLYDFTEVKYIHAFLEFFITTND